MSEHKSNLTNREVVNFFAFHYSDWVVIDKLFWIAISSETSEFSNFFDDDFEEICKQAFPELNINTNVLTAETCREIIQQDYNKWGLLAEVHIADHVGCNGSWIKYVYGETREELFEKIKLLAEQMYKEEE